MQETAKNRIVHSKCIAEVVIKIVGEMTKLRENVTKEAENEMEKKKIQISYKAQRHRKYGRCCRVSVSCANSANIDIEELLNAAFYETSILTIPGIQELAYVFTKNSAKNVNFNGVLQQASYEKDNIFLAPSLLETDSILFRCDTQNFQSKHRLEIKLYHAFLFRHLRAFDEMIFSHTHQFQILNPGTEFQVKRLEKIVPCVDYLWSWYFIKNMVKIVKMSNNQEFRDRIFDIFSVKDEEALNNVTLEQLLRSLE